MKILNSYSIYQFFNRFYDNRKLPLEIMLYNTIQPDRIAIQLLLNKLISHKLIVCIILFLL